MRYIRTKDNKIYELQETKSGEKYLVRTNELIPLWNTREYEIVKQADNIEELFDEYVLVDKVYSVNPDVKDKMMRKCFGKEAFKKELIYGAIWCKGEDGEPILKSVARMIDENGGWELI